MPVHEGPSLDELELRLIHAFQLHGVTQDDAALETDFFHDDGTWDVTFESDGDTEEHSNLANTAFEETTVQGFDISDEPALEIVIAEEDDPPPLQSSSGDLSDGFPMLEQVHEEHEELLVEWLHASRCLGKPVQGDPQNVIAFHDMIVEALAGEVVSSQTPWGSSVVYVPQRVNSLHEVS